MRYPFTEARLVIIEKSTNGVPVVAQQKQIQPLTMRFQVQSLASFSGLRIWRCCKCAVGHRCGSDLGLLWL